MAHPDASPGKIKGRGTKARKTRVIKRETYSRRDFKGLFKSDLEYSYFNIVIFKDFRFYLLRPPESYTHLAFRI